MLERLTITSRNIPEKAQNNRTHVKSTVLGYLKGIDLDKKGEYYPEDNIRTKIDIQIANDKSKHIDCVIRKCGDIIATYSEQQLSNGEIMETNYGLRRMEKSGEYLVLLLKEGINDRGEYSDLFAIDENEQRGFPPENLSWERHRLFCETFGMDLNSKA